MFPRLIGILIALAVLMYFVHMDMKAANREKMWQKSFRQDFRVKAKNMRFSFMDRIFFEAEVAKVPMNMVITMMVAVFVFSALILGLIEQSFFFGLIIGLVAACLVGRFLIKSRYNKTRKSFARALFTEAVPIASHSLEATDRLEEAFDDVARSARHPRVKREFGELSEYWKRQNVTPVEALYRAAIRWEVPEMVRLATITKEAEQYHPKLSQLWLDYNSNVERDMQYERMLKSKTSAGRRNGMIFVCIVLGVFFLAYPRAHQYLTPATNTAFWIATAIISFGAYLIWRTGDNIDV